MSAAIPQKPSAARGRVALAMAFALLALAACGGAHSGSPSATGDAGQGQDGGGGADSAMTVPMDASKDARADATASDSAPPADTGPAVSDGIGAACTSGGQCATGACVPADDFFPGGYCTLLCSSSSDCGPGGICNETLFFNGMTGLPEPICMAGCASSSSCRSGYFCDTSRGAGVCMPQDCRRSAAVCAGMPNACNQETGTCVADAPASGYPATFPAPPQVQKGSGKVIASPTLVPIFFQGDNDSTAPVADIVAFFQGIGASNYWRALSEYGVGAPAAVTPVMLTQSAPATIDDSSQTSALKQLLAGFIDGATNGTPAATSDTIYVLVLPTGTTVTRDGSQTCTTFNGYHDELTLMSGTSVAYAVVPRCSGTALGFQGDLPLLTGVASHELVEAATDPFVDTAPAYLAVDGAHMFFDEAYSGAEIADMCENDPEAFQAFNDFGFVVQRIWSNAAAMAGVDPCVPALAGDTYFNSVPVLPNTVSFPFAGVTSTASAVSIPMGQTGMTTIDLYSEASTSPWTVTVEDYACVTSSASGPLLSFTLSPGTGSATCTAVNDPQMPCVTQTCTGSNGDTIDAAIKVLGVGGASGNDEPAGTELFLVESTQGSGQSMLTHLWWGLVGSP